MTTPRHTLTELEANGFAISLLSSGQQDVLRNLTTEELALLIDIKARLDAVGPEVQAHSEIAGAALF